MNKIQILSVLLLFSLGSCKSLILQKALFGVKKPRVISEHQMKDYLLKHDFDTNNLFLLNPLAYQTLASTNSKYFATWEVYNSDGKLLLPNNDSTSNCIGNVEYFLKYFDGNACRVDSTRFLETDVISNLVNTEILERSKLSEEYTLVLYWSTFMGKYSQDILNLEEIATFSQSKFFVIKVNMDLREDIDDFTINLKN